MTGSPLRLATFDDVDALVALGAQTFRATYRGISDAGEIEDYIRAHFTPREVSDWIAQARTLVAEGEGAGAGAGAGAGGLAGYAVLSREQPPACVTGPAPVKLWRIYLAESVQGRGLGSALLQACLAEARAMGGRTLWLGVYDRNVRAVAFYERRGFRQVGTSDFEFGGRIYADPVMARTLD